jgi:hypothetical protein
MTALRSSALVAAAALGFALPAPSRAAADLEEQILESKYPHGDYAFYVSWHDPWDRQFDEHARFAWPVGGKMRLRFGPRFRLEGDLSYYQRGGEVQSAISVYQVPGFDGLVFGITAQAVVLPTGPFRPYVGLGPVGVSLGNDFAAEIQGVDADVIDRFVLANWSELDLGLQGVVGVDIHLGGRAFPFLEYRHFAGELEVDEIRVSFSRFDAEDLLYLDGSPVSQKYDWSGPNLLLGLRIRF